MEGSSKRITSEFPLSRVRTIMRSGPDIDSLSQESVFLVSKATEAFIRYMVEQVLDANENIQTIEYDHVSHLVQTREQFNFLNEIVPKRTTLREIQERQKQEGMDIVLPGRSPPFSEISFYSDDDFEEEKAASATHETIAIPESSKSGLETSPESSSSVSR